MNKLVVRGPESLFVHKQFFVQLFTGTQTGIFYHYILIRHISRKAYEISRHIVNAHGIAHIQNKNLAAVSIIRCLKHQRHRLRYGHKMSDYVFVGNGYGTSVGDLLFEQRNNAAV